jgi:hypothetical protein
VMLLPGAMMIFARLLSVGYPCVESSWLGAVNSIVSDMVKTELGQSCTTAPWPPACRAALIVLAVPDEMHAACETAANAQMARRFWRVDMLKCCGLVPVHCLQTCTPGSCKLASR